MITKWHQLDDNFNKVGRRKKVYGDHKKCSKCKEVKPMTDFASDRSRPDKKSAYCYVCNRKKSLLYRDKNLTRYKTPEHKINSKLIQIARLVDEINLLRLDLP